MPAFISLCMYCIFGVGISHAAIVQGTVTETGGKPVAGAQIIFTNESYPDKSYLSLTDAAGKYSIDIPENAVDSSVSPEPFSLMQNYPNPFNPSTTIPFIINNSGHATLTVYNILGQPVATLVDEYMSPGNHRVQWNGISDTGMVVGSGVYIYRLQCGNMTETRKMLLLDNAAHVNLSTGGGIVFRSKPAASEIINDSYTVTITGDNIEPFEKKGVLLSFSKPIDFVVFLLPSILFKVQGDNIGVWNGQDYEPLFIKGINLGISVPGTQPGELAATREQYRRWLERIGEIGFNTIRIYTLHYPHFYEEFAAYNRSHPDTPLYLFQGIWLDEEYTGNNLFDMADQFDNEIEEVIDCVHGDRSIDHRFGKAYGVYTVDIARWVIGYIIGREILQDEVINTNASYPNSTRFEGSAVKLDEGTPADIWAAGRIDFTITHERDTYGVQRPVSMSSWPTLDPLTHPTERKDSREDIVAIDLEQLNTDNAPGGYFASYHAYPYYPDFISDDPGYRQYSDDEGPNSYLGYLHDLKSHYAGRPLIIAEYGVPTSWGNAHASASGMDHGGLDEVQQGNYNVRMLKNIIEAGCGGGIVFSWIDEWFKNSWITEPIGSISERRPLWHNLTSPEENFGLIAFDQGQPDYQTWPAYEEAGTISRVQADYDNEFFYLRIDLDYEIAAGDTLIVGYDTYRSDLGESVLPNGVVTGDRSEFCLIVSPQATAQLYVTKAYDLFGIWHGISDSDQLFHSVATDNAPWVPVRWKNNIYEDAVQEIGLLRMRNEAETPTTLDAVVWGTRRVDIRLPWTLLQFTDPSALQVMDDNRATPARETAVSDGIAVTVTLGGAVVRAGRFIWPSWDRAPQTVEREKASVEIIERGLSEIPSIPPKYISYPPVASR